jgi:hypothetical protein
VNDERPGLPPMPPGWMPATGEQVAAFREDFNREMLPVALDLAVLARHGALGGVAEVIAERRRQVEQGDGYGNGWLRGSLGAWMAAGDWGRQGLREAAALIAAEIDREGVSDAAGSGSAGELGR